MKKMIFLIVSGFVLSSDLLAHFQMVYTPNTALKKAKTIEFRHIFTHPFSDEHTMDMVGVEEFYVINKNKKKDLKDSLKEITFKGTHNSAKAFESKYKAQRMGDHLFVLKPKPYYEKMKMLIFNRLLKLL